MEKEREVTTVKEKEITMVKEKEVLMERVKEAAKEEAKEGAKDTREQRLQLTEVREGGNRRILKMKETKAKLQAQCWRAKKEVGQLVQHQ